MRRKITDYEKIKEKIASYRENHPGAGVNEMSRKLKLSRFILYKALGKNYGSRKSGSRKPIHKGTDNTQREGTYQKVRLDSGKNMSLSPDIQSLLMQPSRELIQAVMFRGSAEEIAKIMNGIFHDR